MTSGTDDVLLVRRANVDEPGHRGRGLARRLVRDVADVLRAAGLRRITGHDGACWLDLEL